MQGMKLLLVEDDFDLSGVLGRSLSHRGFEVLCCADGIEALAAARKKRFDVVVLDLSLPGLDGLELLQRLRGDGNRTPVLVLTARGAVGERIAGLNAGADDYLAKPFDLDELIARLGALTRRLGRDGELRCGRLRYEAASNAFYRDESPLELSPREADLLKSLMSRVDHVVPREALRNAVFGADEANAEAIEVIVHRLRKKLAGASVEIMTLRGVGYLLCDDASSVVQQQQQQQRAAR
ncbi:response regulator transcription factor [Variovorax sp. W6]|uniref:response regulator transcription factor n=1 Tax=Variovorax sp. W6 TaxID=3093895 RepID=UPI003D80958D